MKHFTVWMAAIVCAAAASGQEPPVPERDAGKPGVIEGILVLGGEPLPGERIVLERNDAPLENADTPGIRYAMTDDAGRFRFEEVAPGEVRVGLFYVFDVINAGFHELGATPSHRVPLQLEPGATATIQIGGTGKRVTGILSGTLPGDRAYAFQGATTRLLRRILDPIPFPENLSAEDRGNWYRDWIKTEEGRAYRRAYTSYVFDIDADGRFYAVDIPPGEYRLHTEIPEQGRQEAGPIAIADTTVVVPDDSADVVDVGMIALKRVKQ